MGSVIDENWTCVRLDVRVWVDPLDTLLPDAVGQSASARSIEEAVADELRSGLQSVDWVRHESVQARRNDMVVKVSTDKRNSPPGKLADVELHFPDGELAGFRLIGFAVWERKRGTSRDVSFPSKNYTANGERRSFALLRTIGDPGSQERLRDLILSAYAEYEANPAP